MRTTPPIPDWIQQARVPGFVTAHQVCQHETRLYGTESLFGDWDAEILLLAKDWGPSCILHERMESGDQRPWHHAMKPDGSPARIAGKRLQELASPLQHRGLLYGSALANLLRDDGRVSGSLPNREEAVAYGTRVTGWVVAQMPKLRWVMCLGLEAWECASGAVGVEGDWSRHRDNYLPLGKLIAAYHPSARISKERMAGPWGLLARLLREDLSPAA
ncbi:MAG: hypothetical protein ACKVXR_15605 [Planctomycetota bacterium]